MKVRYTRAFGVPRGKGISVGDEAEVTKDQAERLISKGYAEPVKSTKREKATSRKASSAEKRGGASPSDESAE
jgi:hypothetical protein